MAISQKIIRALCTLLAGLGVGIGVVILYVAIENHGAISRKSNQLLTRVYGADKRGVVPDGAVVAARYREHELPAIFRMYFLGGALCTGGAGLLVFPSWRMRDRTLDTPLTSGPTSNNKSLEQSAVVRSN